LSLFHEREFLAKRQMLATSQLERILDQVSV